MMQEPERRIARFEDLNLLGKAVFAGGAAVRITANLIDKVIDRAVDMVIDVEKAFKEGLDPNVEDAKVLDERIDR